MKYASKERNFLLEEIYITFRMKLVRRNSEVYRCVKIRGDVINEYLCYNIIAIQQHLIDISKSPNKNISCNLFHPIHS
jgi:hypothetical protein